MSLADRIDAVLPQTQCTRCGFPDCRSYAEAVAGGVSTINRCPPGGEETIARLSGLTGQPVRPLDPECGMATPYAVAVIDEDWCIGCTICLQYCPVDAIVGAVKRMHTVIARECTGCELCVAPCPVDCIEMISPESDGASLEIWLSTRAHAARSRYLNRRRRLTRLQDQRRRRRRGRRLPTYAQRKAEIASAKARVQTRHRRPAPPDSD